MFIYFNSDVDKNNKDVSLYSEDWLSTDLRLFYKNTFKDALATYNAKQTRESRKIKDYYLHIKNDASKKLFYEIIVCIFDEPNIEENIKKDICKKYVEDWEKRNPNLKLVSVLYHKKGENDCHCHIRFVPIATGFERGLSTQNSFSKAIAAQSERDGKLEKLVWQQKEHRAFCSLCKSAGISCNYTYRPLGLIEREIEKLSNVRETILKISNQ